MLYGLLRPFGALWDIFGNGTVAFDLVRFAPVQRIASLGGDQERSAFQGPARRIWKKQDHCKWRHLAFLVLHGSSVASTVLYLMVHCLSHELWVWRLRCVWNGSNFSPRALMLAQMVLIVGASWFMAQIVPFFADFVSLLGATLTPLIAFIVPLLLYGLCISTNDAHLQQEPMP